jgi:Ca2+-binding EF-hand superfamily protein
LQFTLRYVNKGRLDSIVSIESIYDKLRSRGRGMRGEILNVFRMLDDEGSGRVSLDDLVNVIRKFNFDLDEDELIALMGRWDSAKDGFVQYEAFVSTIFE